MPNTTINETSTKDASHGSFQITPPSITVPKGGGAMRGIGEKFGVNPVTGTGSLTIPIYTSPGRNGFGPQLTLSYDSGAGNGSFGFGWSLSLPSITRKTDKGLPQYDNAADSDVFLLSGAEDLVPVFRQDKDGTWINQHPGYTRDLDTSWVRDPKGRMVIHEEKRGSYIVRRYRPRIEGLFARIERWTHETDETDVSWRSISKDNITTWYGKSPVSRISDPGNHAHIFSWLICESHDDKGNAIRYEYKAEDSENVLTDVPHEINRTTVSRSANRYLKRVKYGNKKSHLVQPDLNQAEWLFEVVFDYGEHDAEKPLPNQEVKKWEARQDPFSSYRAGFELRTHRLCQRVLMFHHFPNEPIGADCLVRSTDFIYSYESRPHDAHNPVYSFIESVEQVAYQRNGQGAYARRAFPPVTFQYAPVEVSDSITDVDPASIENLPSGLDGSNYQWVDLEGEGLSGVLTEQGTSWFYKRNLSPATERTVNDRKITDVQLASLELVAAKPAIAALHSGGQQLLDLAGDGQLDLVALQEPLPGFYERTADDQWETFKTFRSLPNRNWSDPNLRFIDLTGDGHADVLITENDVLCWHPSLAEDGFGPASYVPQAHDEEKGPRLIFADGTQSIFLADMSGDGLVDMVRIRNGEICYWPNLGYGRFGAKVTMTHSPTFDTSELFDQRRIRLADIDGSGTTDIIYLHHEGVHLYFNQSGNGWSAKQALAVFPPIDNLADIMTADLLGNGTACLVWSSPLEANARRPMRYVDLMGGQKPHVMIHMANNLGADTHITYAPSTKFYVKDRLAGHPWITRIPFPVHCVEKVTVTDKWRKTIFSSTYSYHHGYFDGVEREFRGFGRVEQVDTEDYGTFAKGNADSPYITDDQTLYQPPVKTVTWFHTGAFLDRDKVLSHYEKEYFPEWFEALQPDHQNVLGGFQEQRLPEPDLLTQDLSAEEWREALRACKGMVLRQEIYELDVDKLIAGEHQPVKLFSTAYHNCHIERLQPQADNRHAVFLVSESEALTYHYELALPASGDFTPDPRVTHTLNLRTDEFGQVLQSVSVGYPRLAPQKNFLDQILTDKPIAYYRFGESAGAASVKDLSGNNNHGVQVEGAVTLGVSGLGVGDTAAQFDGDSGRVIVHNSDSLNPPHITMEALVQWHGPQSSQPTIYQRILEKSSFQGLAQYGFGIVPDGRVTAELRTSSAAVDASAFSITSVTPGTAVHIAVTYDGNSIRIYLNGKLDSETPAPGSISPKPPTPTNLVESGIGLGNETQRARPFHGIIDELVLYDKPLPPDRIHAHAMAAFPAPEVPELIEQVQSELHVAYTETRYTQDAEDEDNYRLRLPCEVSSYELTGVSPSDGHYFTVDELRQYRLSPDLYQRVKQPGDHDVSEIPYHHLPDRTVVQKRVVERVRTLFFDKDLSKFLPFGRLNTLGLKYEDYKLALTDELLQSVIGASKLTQPVQSDLKNYKISGYLNGQELANRFPNHTTEGEYWIRSGVAGFSTDAADHFYLPERYIDPFDNVTTLTFDPKYDLFVQSSTDTAGNTTSVESFDYRVLAPLAMKDMNDNLTEMQYDLLSLPTVMAVRGKGTEGDNLDNITADILNPPLDDVIAFFQEDFQDASARRLLGNATARYVYHFGEKRQGGKLVYAADPPSASTILRERHLAQLGTNEQNRLQVAFEYSDGMGTVLLKKAQAEPADGSTDRRWLATGKTVLNNKGRAVKQYEPYFSLTEHRFDPSEAERNTGVTPLIYYDAVGRSIRTELPDGSFSRVEFSPWHTSSFDANDTAYDPTGVYHSDWYRRRTDPTHPRFAEFNNSEDQRAAELVKVHVNTPSQVFLDSLGREVISVVHNAFAYPNGGPSGNEQYRTFTKLDAEGKPLWIRDARGNLVMQYITPPVANDAPTDPATGFVPCYDIAGNLLFQHSMDAGDRRMLNDAAGEPLYAWDANERRESDGITVIENRIFKSKYDQLHRPIERWLSINGGADQMIERFTYGEGVATDKQNNLRGHLREHVDQSGRKTVQAYDFKGNVLAVERVLASKYREPVIGWQTGSQTAGLEQEFFVRRTEYDALNRMTRLYNWHRGTDGRVAVYEPRYNERGTLLSEDVLIRALKTATAYSEDGQSIRTPAIKNITYNAKGQREKIEYGNGTITRYEYDPETFRLSQLRTTRPSYDPSFPSRRSQFKNDRVLQNLFYTYDPVGNITDIYDDAYEPTFFDNQQVDPKNQYTYDSLYRLIAAFGRETTQGGQSAASGEEPIAGRGFPITDHTLRQYQQRFHYDAVGNFRVMEHRVPTDNSQGWTRNYASDGASNRLIRTWMGTQNWDNTPTDKRTEYLYDLHGNMQNLATVNPAQYIRWDSRDMIRELDLFGGGRAYYNYDSDKQRSRKVLETQDGTKQWERIDLGGFEWYRRYVGGNVVEEIETHHLADGSQRIVLIEDVLKTNKPNLPTGPLYRYQYGNHLGSACLELNHQADIVSYEEYHPYGTSAYRAMKSGIEASTKRYQYTGKERDDESGLYYHGARYYAEWLGRWVNCDPIGIGDGVNIFLYVRNNPTLLKDPNGTVAGVDDLTVAAVAAFAAVVIFTIYWTLPSTQASIRKSVNDLSERLSVPRVSPFYKGDPEAYKPKPKDDPKPSTKPEVKPKAGPKPDPKPDPKPKGDRPPPPPPPPIPPEKQPDLKRAYVAYVKTNPDTLMHYSGRTSGIVDLNKPLQPQLDAIVAFRDIAHGAGKSLPGYNQEMFMLDEWENQPNETEIAKGGYGPAQLYEYSLGEAVIYRNRYKDKGYLEIRGVEQQMIDFFGGAWSDTKPNKRTGNEVRGVAKDHPRRRDFHNAANAKLGHELHRYTGN